MKADDVRRWRRGRWSVLIHERSLSFGNAVGLSAGQNADATRSTRLALWLGGCGWFSQRPDKVSLCLVSRKRSSSLPTSASDESA